MLFRSWATRYSAGMATPLVEMEGVDKRFPGVQALSQARFDLQPGEVHALVGENGAGKSTLMKILAGVTSKDRGRIRFKGREVTISTPRAARALGISMIHQELQLLPHLTVAQNIFLGREPRRWPGFVLDEAATNARARKVLDELNVGLAARVRVSGLAVAKQQAVEIAKALSCDADVLIMDEPSAALTDTEIADLFRIIRRLREKGVGVVYISHRLEELKHIADRITVMRDGQYVDTVPASQASLEQIVSMMVGRVLEPAAVDLPTDRSAEVVLEARGLRRGRAVRGVSFALHRGEILGIAGLVGAGRTEVARALFGADPLDAGEILVHGRRVHIRSPSDAVRLGIGYLSEDRKRYGLALAMNIETNMVLASLGRFVGWLGRVRTAETRAAAERSVAALGIRTPGVTALARNLSGGNQQKVVVGRWLIAGTRILIFDEPTRGIDVAAKGEIYKLLEALARQGTSIIMISSELPELLRVSHRLLVMCEGRVTGELPARATEEQVMTLATSRAPAAPHDAPQAASH